MSEDEKPKIQRNEKGHFAKGVSPNPGGRKVKPITQLAQQDTLEAYGVILGIMRSDADYKTRLDAAKYVIDRGWGRPKQDVGLGSDLEGGGSLKIEIVRFAPDSGENANP